MIGREVNTNHRDEDPFFHGFMPVWALTLFAVAILFAVIFIVGIICHLAGCRTPKEDLPTQLNSLIVQRSRHSTSKASRQNSKDVLF